jgi:hypothetical protein
MQNRMAEFVELCCNSPESVVTLKTGLCRSERRPEKNEIRTWVRIASSVQSWMEDVLIGIGRPEVARLGSDDYCLRS